jgi:hypothetical protein
MLLSSPPRRSARFSMRKAAWRRVKSIPVSARCCSISAFGASVGAIGVPAAPVPALASEPSTDR